jgi:hypothetical protein
MAGDSGRDTGGEQVEAAVAQGGVEVDGFGLPMQPHVLELAVLGDQQPGQFQIRCQTERRHLAVADDFLFEQEPQYRQILGAAVVLGGPQHAEPGRPVAVDDAAVVGVFGGEGQLWPCRVVAAGRGQVLSGRL